MESRKERDMEDVTTGEIPLELVELTSIDALDVGAGKVGSRDILSLFFLERCGERRIFPISWNGKPHLENRCGGIRESERKTRHPYKRPQGRNCYYQI